ncbi:hypothetical protein PPYR_12480 [Photinus pyralis]|uniref:Glucuronosyltransferase n=1 Tax=Photinus pyralis TaxID=7054 RepID=A0A5N4AEA9_PHOPY|nr:hypothetical protein PPYR_12480 [Photinus pyralis]
MRVVLFQTVYILNVILAARGARILGIFHLQSYSHHQLGDKLFKELAARGHEVTLITGYETKENVTNLKTIVVNTHLKGTSTNMFRMSEGSMLWSNMKFDNYLLSVAEGTLSDDNVQALIKSKEHFDIVILERLRNEAFHGFCAHFKAHCVLSTSMPASRLINLQLGNSAPPSYVPEMCSTFSNNMNFFERLSNAFAYVFLTIWYRSYMQPLHNNLMHKHFPDVPDLSDIFHNISLMLINAHTATNPPVPLLPNMIDIGEIIFGSLSHLVKI